MNRDEPGADSDRAYVEQNAIAILCNFEKQPIDSRPDGSLGRYSQSREIRESGLWHVNHVKENCEGESLELFEKTIKKTTPP